MRRLLLACLACAMSLSSISSVCYAAQPAAFSPQQLFDAGQFAQARDAYQALVKKNPDHPDLNIGLIRTLLRLDDWQDAIAAGSQAMQNCPQNADIAGLSALANFRAGQMDTAESLSDKALKLGPNSYWALVTSGKMALWNDQPASALNDFELASKIDPNNPDAWLGISKVSTDADTPKIPGLDSDAERALKAYIGLAPKGYPHDKVLPAARIQAGRDFQDYLKMRRAHRSQIVAPFNEDQWKALDRGAGVFSLTIPIQIKNGQIWIPAKINGHLFQLLFDTGSSGIRLNKKEVALLKLKPLTRSQVGGVVGIVNEDIYLADSVSIGSLVIKPEEVSSLNTPQAHVDGLFGVPMLDPFVFTLDFKNKTLTLARGRDAAAPDPIPRNTHISIPFHCYNDDIIVPLSVDPTSIWNSDPVMATFDTGSLVNILSLPLAQKLAAKLAPSDFDKGTFTNVPSIGGSVKKLDWLSINPNLTLTVGNADTNLYETYPGLNGLSLINGVISPLEGIEMGAILGEPYCERCSRVTFDYRRRLLTFDMPVAPQSQNNQSDNQASSPAPFQSQQGI